MSNVYRSRAEKGAAAVEFALVVPILLSLIFGIIEFSLAFNYRTQLQNAAMTSARHYAIHRNVDDAKAAARSVATIPTTNPPGANHPGDPFVITGTCPIAESATKNTVTVSIYTPRRSLTNYFGRSFETSARASVVCM